MLRQTACATSALPQSPDQNNDDQDAYDRGEQRSDQQGTIGHQSACMEPPHAVSSRRFDDQQTENEVWKR
jgi:hypothetical protein